MQVRGRHARWDNRRIITTSLTHNTILKLDLHVVFPLLGGPRTAILIGTTGLGDGCLRYNIGSAMNCSRACDEDKK